MEVVVVVEVEGEEEEVGKVEEEAAILAKLVEEIRAREKEICTLDASSTALTPKWSRERSIS